MKINLVEVNNVKVLKIDFGEETSEQVTPLFNKIIQNKAASLNSLFKFLSVKDNSVYTHLISLELVSFILENINNKKLRYPVSVKRENFTLSFSSKDFSFNTESIRTDSSKEEILSFIKTFYQAYDYLKECFEAEETIVF